MSITWVKLLGVLMTNLRFTTFVASLTIFLSACGPLAFKQQKVSFKTYSSIYEDVANGTDTGMGINDDSENNGDGGLGNNNSTGDGGTQVSNNGDGGSSTPNSTPDGGAGMPNNTPDGGTGMPTTTPDGGFTAPWTNVDGGMGMPSNTPDGGGFPWNTPDGGGMPMTTPDGGTIFSKNPDSSIPDNLFVHVNIEKSCQAGEIDMIRAIMLCVPDQNLIMTLKDANGERLIENFGSVSSEKSSAQIVKNLKQLAITDNLGSSIFDLFICIDSNNNNSCLDEEVRDLNSLNEPIVDSVLFLANGAEMMVRQALCGEDKLGQIKNGLVLYHQEYVEKTSEVQSSMVMVRALAAKEMAKYVKNITAKTDVQNYTDGTGIQLNLVESNRQACKEVGARMHGCFISGTKIKLSKELEVPVEKFRAGDSVMLSNGQRAKIAKVVSGPENKPVIKMTLATGESITVTETHPMLTEMGVVQAKDLRIGSRLLTEKGWAMLQSMSKEKYSGLVHNIELVGAQQSDHLIYGNGIVTGDLYLQQQLQSKPLPGLHFSLLDY